MNDESSITSWQDNFSEWVEFAKPLLSEGKGQDAFAKLPCVTTEVHPVLREGQWVSETRFGLVTTGGYSIEGEQEPMRGYPTFGDEVAEIRRIPVDVDRSKLKINHPGYDHKYAQEDINANLPLDRLSELVSDGSIGSLSPETLVLMGLQPNAAPLIRETIPEIIAAFKADDVDAALLFPS